jgi:hypothetical protein
VVAHTSQQKVTADLVELHHTDKTVDDFACTLCLDSIVRAFIPHNSLFNVSKFLPEDSILFADDKWWLPCGKPQMLGSE